MAAEGNGFKVEDRRFMDDDGTMQGSRETTAPNSQKPEPSIASGPATPPPGGEGDSPLTFQDLVLSLSTTAMLQLGFLANPQSGKAEQDLAGAKQTIDTLQILNDKTMGNLREEESILLESSLFDLKMMFLKTSSRIQL